MRHFPVLDDNLDLSGKRVLVRADLDIKSPRRGDLRLKALVPTLQKLLEVRAVPILIGHRGRPDGKEAPELSLAPVVDIVKELLEADLEFLENLRFDPGEEGNSEEFAKALAAKGDFFVNEAFAASHREHASIVSLPKFLPHAAGLRFQKEVGNLSRLFSPKRPFVVILSGAKEDKLGYLDKLAQMADRVLVAGRLPLFLGEYTGPKVKKADLIQDREDITLKTIEKFKSEIATARTILISGPLGRFEEEGHLQGTREVFSAAGKADAFKVAGGGDTEAAIRKLGIGTRFDWISVGGGAMLEFVTKRTLPGIEAVL